MPMTISIACHTPARQSKPVASRALMTGGMVQGTWAMQGLMMPGAGKAIGDADEQIGKKNERDHERQVVHDGVTVDNRLVDVEQTRQDSILETVSEALFLENRSVSSRSMRVQPEPPMRRSC